jgi:hypothetical protein
MVSEMIWDVDRVSVVWVLGVVERSMTLEPSGVGSPVIGSRTKLMFSPKIS